MDNRWKSKRSTNTTISTQWDAVEWAAWARLSPHRASAERKIKRNHVALNLTRSKLFTSSLPLTSRHTPVWGGGVSGRRECGSTCYEHRTQPNNAGLGRDPTNHNTGGTPSPPVIGSRRGWGENPSLPVKVPVRGRGITKSNGYLFAFCRRVGNSHRIVVGLFYFSPFWRLPVCCIPSRLNQFPVGFSLRVVPKRLIRWLNLVPRFRVKAAQLATLTLATTSAASQRLEGRTSLTFPRVCSFFSSPEFCTTRYSLLKLSNSQHGGDALYDDDNGDELKRIKSKWVLMGKSWAEVWNSHAQEECESRDWVISISVGDTCL